jgi:hypothetical protein
VALSLEIYHQLSYFWVCSLSISAQECADYYKIG